MESDKDQAGLTISVTADYWYFNALQSQEFTENKKNFQWAAVGGNALLMRPEESG